jgi:DNA-binding LacI/PurR family transcriptional regulator
MRRKDSRPLAEQRRRSVLDLIQQQGQVTVNELVEKFSISAVTARGDLDALSSEGAVVRSHGGAVRQLDAYQDYPIRLKETLLHNEREKIGRAAALRDIAKLAKVSSAAVSRVASGNPQVDEELQARVHAAARKLGIDLTGTLKNRVIAFVLGNRDVLNEFQSRILLGAEAYCNQHGWDLQFISFRCDLSAPAGNLRLPPALTRQDRCGGVILSGTHSVSILSALRERRIPFSVAGNNIIGDWRFEDYDCVATDDLRGSAEITKHLISQGHRNIWFIGDRSLPWYARCAQGYCQSMSDAGLEPRYSEIRSEDRELGYLAVKSLLAKNANPTALFVGSDHAVTGVYQALQESGIHIPDDISVAGFNDTMGDVLYPNLTSVREFPKELGIHLAEFVLRRIQQPDIAPQQLLMPTEMIRRDSVRMVDPMLAEVSLTGAQVS